MSVTIELHDGDKVIKKASGIPYVPSIIQFQDDVFVWAGYDKTKDLNLFRKANAWVIY